ncbi:MAG: mobilization protein C [Acidobacteria bacterium]|nr:mobilization protein C [Acidobacteriota bacterium]
MDYEPCIVADGTKADGDKTAQLEALKKRLEKTRAQIMAIETRHKEQARKDDTRLKVLIGAAHIADAEVHEETQSAVKRVLERAITAPRDREFLKEKGWL